MVNWQRLRKPGFYSIAFLIGYCLASNSCDGVKDIVKKELGTEGISGLLEQRAPRPSTWLCHETYKEGKWYFECYDMLQKE